MNNKRTTGMKFSAMQVGVLIVLAGMACFLLGIVAGYTYRGIGASPQPQYGSNIVATIEATATQLPAIPPTWTLEPTDTPPSTWTPRPTKTPRPTNTPFPTWTPHPTDAPVPRAAPLGEIEVDQWKLLITGVESLPGQNSNQQIVVVFVTLTNYGSEGVFSTYYTLELMDTRGRRYTEDVIATGNVRAKYGIDAYADVSVPPDSTVEVLYAYIAPVGERTFTIVPGDLVSSWSGDVTFSLP